MGLFGNLFDLNGDGKLDAMEQGIELGAFSAIMDAEEAGEVQEELEEAGLDLDDLALMDEDERRETLEEAGLDPDDFDEF